MVRYILEQVQLFCQKPPKGFEKYFPGGKPAAGKQASEAGGKTGEAKQPAEKRSSSASASEQKSSNDWNFGMFSNTNKSGGGGNKGGSGRPLGNEGGDKEKWMILGAIGAVALLGSIAFFEMGYKEVGWKDFVNG